MAYEPRRTLLVGLSALAVVLAAALFPAAGVGSHPAGTVGVGDPGVVDTPEATPTPEPADTPTPERRDETPTEPDDTPSPTPTQPPGNDQNGGSILPELSLAALLGALVKLFGATLALSALVALAVVVRGVEPGTPHVDLPFGYTLTLPFVVPEWVGSLGTRVSRQTMGFVVSLSASVTQLLDAVAAALTAVTNGLGIVAGEGLRGVVALAARLPGAIASALAGLTVLPAALLSLPAALSTVGGSIAGGSDRPGQDARAAGPAPEVDEAPDEPGPRSVEEAWLAMVDLLPVERTPSTTPAEFARRAIDSGVPAAPVQRVTRTFEDVVYGGQAAGDRATAAREALASLRDRLGGGGA